MTKSSNPTHSSPNVVARSDHDCFGCGNNNAIGLHLQFEPLNEGVKCLFIPKFEHQGFEDIVHGGIISTVLDEAMAWATVHSGLWAVTAEMSVRFRRPLQVGEPTTVTARVSGRRGRSVTTEAQLTRIDDLALIATASATFMKVSESVERSWRARYLLEPNSPDSALANAPAGTNNTAATQSQFVRSCDDGGDAIPGSN